MAIRLSLVVRLEAITRAKAGEVLINQAYLSQNGWELKLGDIGYNDGHTGLFSDSAVIRALCSSTPHLRQVFRFPELHTPTGSYSSEAAALAKKYMSYYSGYGVFNYHTSVGNYIRQYNFLRWNGSTLSDRMDITT